MSATNSRRFSQAEKTSSGLDPELVADLHAKSGAAAFDIEHEQFAILLRGVLQRAESADAGSNTEHFLRSLRIEELALAHGCVLGNQHAWDVFLTRYRESIYQSARSITRDESKGKELADSLYAELYGLGTAEERRSKLALYSGRGSMAGWLRMVLAQSFVDRIRAGKRLVSLEAEEEERGFQIAAAAPEETVSGDPRLIASLDAALAELSSEERFLLSAYFLDGRKLAEIGRTLGVHESTISRKLEKLLGRVRKQVRKGMETRGMSRRQAEEALEVDVRDLTVDLARRLR